MFILIVNEDNRRIDSVSTRVNEAIYLYKDDERRFPLLSLLDDYSHTFFTIDDIDLLVGELNITKNEYEIQSEWEHKKNECLSEIISLESKCNNVYDKKHFRVVESKKRLAHMKEVFQLMEQGKIISQSIPEVIEHLDAIISLAQKCRIHHNSTLIHSPFQ